MPLRRYKDRFEVSGTKTSGMFDIFYDSLGWTGRLRSSARCPNK